jgi:hypothetical protein
LIRNVLGTLRNCAIAGLTEVSGEIASYHKCLPPRMKTRNRRPIILACPARRIAASTFSVRLEWVEGRHSGESRRWRDEMPRMGYGVRRSLQLVTVAPSSIWRTPSLLEACACALPTKRREIQMSKLLTTLIAGLFAVSAFAADAPKPAAAPEVKPAIVAAPAATEVKPAAAAPAAAQAATKVEKKAVKKAVEATPAAATPATPAVPATPATPAAK